MRKPFLSWGALLGGLAVALGAFGAHGLKQVAGPGTVAVFQTGVQYQMYHALALLVTGLLLERSPHRRLVAAGYCFLAGIGLFSGSLYLLTYLEVAGRSGLGVAGVITPVGGLFFLAGWLLLLLGLTRLN
ncbi:MAG TPA: DUF423 domain-containing protein [Chitinophagaceae bacterium]|nr:DUF423 domain-containing protein [Chitinophagaceae bacterium]